jgi:DNA polymerase-3 subunit epsilon
MPRRQRLEPLKPRVTEADRVAHWEFVVTLGEKAIWNDFL